MKPINLLYIGLFFAAVLSATGMVAYGTNNHDDDFKTAIYFDCPGVEEDFGLVATVDRLPDQSEAITYGGKYLLTAKEDGNLLPSPIVIKFGDENYYQTSARANEHTFTSNGNNIVIRHENADTILDADKKLNVLINGTRRYCTLE